LLQHKVSPNPKVFFFQYLPFRTVSQCSALDPFRESQPLQSIKAFTDQNFQSLKNTNSLKNVQNIKSFLAYEKIFCYIEMKGSCLWCFLAVSIIKSIKAKPDQEMQIYK